MKAVILAAGMGKRMLPLTKETHKCLLEVGNKPLIGRQYDELKKASIDNITVILGYMHDKIQNYLGNKVCYAYNPFFETTNSIVSLWLALMNIDDDILITNADVIFDKELVLKLTDKSCDINIAISEKWSDERGYKAETAGAFVVDMGMDIPRNKIGGEYAGMVFVSKNEVQKLKEKCHELLMKKQFNIWFEDMITELIKDGTKAKAVYVNPDNWYEIDTVAELEYARNKFN